MKHAEIAAQLEFFRDIGIRELDVAPSEGRAADVGDVGTGDLTGNDLTSVDHGAIPMSSSESNPTLEDVRSELGDCQRCALAGGRTNIVFGTGNSGASLVFVGEAPGAEEDRQGLPFVGRAGQLLTKIIESIGMKREDVYICNVLKCRPPGNRNPEPAEVESCSPFLRKQIDVMRPKIVCCMGTFAAQTVLGMKTPISRLRGQFHEIGGVKYIATFHPAYLLRNPEKKREVWEDMKKIRAELMGS